MGGICIEEKASLFTFIGMIGVIVLTIFNIVCIYFMTKLLKQLRSTEASINDKVDGLTMSLQDQLHQQSEKISQTCNNGIQIGLNQAIGTLGNQMEQVATASQNIMNTMHACTDQICKSAQIASTQAAVQATQKAHETAAKEWSNAVNQITASCRAATDTAIKGMSQKNKNKTKNKKQVMVIDDTLK